MKELDEIQMFFKGLIDFFFDPCREDEGQEQVIELIQKSKMNERLGRPLLPTNPMDSLCSSGWGYKEYAEAIKSATEQWCSGTDCREAASLDEAMDED